MPEGLTGNFSFYVNNELKGQWNAQEFIEEPFYYGEYYEIKSYNFTVNYSGDDYFYPASKSKMVEFCANIIEIPEEVVSSYDDTIYVYSDYDTRSCNVIIKINNKTVFKKDKINSCKYRLGELEANKQYEIEVSISSNYYNKTKRTIVNVSDYVKNYVKLMGKYGYAQDDFKYTYSYESNRYYIISPKLDLNITIDNNTVESNYDEGCYIIDVSGLAPGKHVISVSYGDDAKYAKNTFTGEFEVVFKALCLSEVKQNELNYFTLNLLKMPLETLQSTSKNWKASNYSGRPPGRPVSDRV